MEIFAVNLKTLPNELVLSALMSLVPKEKTDKLSRFKKKEDCCRSLAAELLIRVVLVEKTRLKNRDIHFGYNAYGKPFLMDYPLNFNLSHAGNWIVCAIDETPIGIDIEEMKQIDLNIAKRFFSNIEWMKLVQEPEEDKLDYFYNLWTLKESYIKNVGLGLSIPLHLISFTINGENIEFKNRYSHEIRHFKQYNMDDLYKFSVCACENNFPERISIRSFAELTLESFLLLCE